MKNKELLLLFPDLTDVHIYKDVGMIPATLQSLGGVECTIATYARSNLADVYSKRGIRLLYIKRITGIATLDSAIFLLRNHSRFNILHVYHLTRFAIVMAWIFRGLKIIRGEKSEVFLKLDLNQREFNFQVSGLRREWLRFLCQPVTVATIETTFSYESLENMCMFRTLYLLPNGYFYPDRLQLLQHVAKEDILLCVTRAGSYQKNTEELLSVVPWIIEHYPQWRIIVAGPVEPEFGHKIEEFYCAYPHARGVLSFLGNISDREKLEDLYARSKVLLSTSRWEGYPLAAVEGRRWGLKIVSSDVSGISDILRNSHAGHIYTSGNRHELERCLKETMNDSQYFDKKHYVTDRDRFSESFSWEKMLSPVHAHLLKAP